MLCSSAVLPRAKIIQGLFLLIFSFLPRSGISASLHGRSAQHNYSSASQKELVTQRAWITRQYWISNMVNKKTSRMEIPICQTPESHKSGIEYLLGATNMMWMLLIQDCLGYRGTAGITELDVLFGVISEIWAFFQKWPISGFDFWRANPLLWNIEMQEHIEQGIWYSRWLNNAKNITGLKRSWSDMYRTRLEVDLGPVFVIS